MKNSIITTTQGTAYETNQKHSARSNRYQHVTTKDLGDVFTNHGFNLVKYSQAKVHDAADFQHAKHLVKFRHNGEIKIGDTVPELLIKNDGLGKGSLKISFGLYRLVCANGLVIGTSFFNYKFNHNKDILANLNQAVPQILNQSDVLRDQVLRLSALDTTGQQRLDLAAAAVEIMTKNSSLNLQSADLSQLLKTRRWADSDEKAWSVFNRIQENVFRGRIIAVILNDKNEQEFVTLKKVGENSQRAIEINKDLWNAAESIFNITSVGA